MFFTHLQQIQVPAPGTSLTLTANRSPTGGADARTRLLRFEVIIDQEGFLLPPLLTGFTVVPSSRDHIHQYHLTPARHITILMNDLFGSVPRHLARPRRRTDRAGGLIRSGDLFDSSR